MTFTHEFVFTELHFWSIYLGLSKQNQGKCFENTLYSKHMHKQPVATGLKWNKRTKKITQWRVYLFPLIMISKCFLLHRHLCRYTNTKGLTPKKWVTSPGSQQKNNQFFCAAKKHQQLHSIFFCSWSLFSLAKKYHYYPFQSINPKQYLFLSFKEKTFYDPPKCRGMLQRKLLVQYILWI